MRESVLLPVSSIIGKLDLSIKMNVHIVQESKIKRLSNDESLSLWQMESSSIVSLLDALVELGRDIILVVLAGANSDHLAMASLDRVLVRVLGSELLNAARDASRKLNGFGDGASEEGQSGFFEKNKKLNHLFTVVLL